MNKRRLAHIVPGLALLITACVFIACGGNGITVPQDTNIQANQPGLQDSPESQNSGQLPADNGIINEDSEPANRVILEVPDIHDRQAGTVFTAVISVDLAERVHQGVLRLQFDPASMTPVEVTPGSMLPADMIRIADVSKQGFIPLAFTALPQGRNIETGRGELFRIRFRLETAGSNAGRIGFHTEREFRQLRDTHGDPIRFNVDNRAGGRNAD